MTCRRVTRGTIIVAIATLVAINPFFILQVDRVGGVVTDPGQGVVNYFIDLFNGDWSTGTAYDNGSDGMGYGQSYDRNGSLSFTPFKRDALDISGNMTITPVISPVNSGDVIIELVNSATTSLYVEQMYIYETLDDVLSSLVNARGRGVDVKVIQGYTSFERNDASGNILESAGIVVKRLKSNSSSAYPVPFDTMHNKGIIVDNETVLVSSINWSPTSLRDNREAGLVVRSPAVAAYYTDLFMHDWNGSIDLESNSTSFTPSSPDPHPALESFSGRFDVTCLASPDNCFDAVNGLLASASDSIWISVYTLSSPYLMETLLDRIANGVDVRLLLEKYQVDSYEQNYTRWTMMNLTVLGVDVGGYNVTASGKWASTSFDYQHCKYAIIDNDTLVLSSGNWGRSSCPKPQDDGDVDGNRDWWFVVHGSGAGGDIDEGGDLPWWAWLSITIIGIVGGAFIQLKKKPVKAPPVSGKKRK